MITSLVGNRGANPNPKLTCGRFSLRIIQISVIDRSYEVGVSLLKPMKFGVTVQIYTWSINQFSNSTRNSKYSVQKIGKNEGNFCRLFSLRGPSSRHILSGAWNIALMSFLCAYFNATFVQNLMANSKNNEWASISYPPTRLPSVGIRPLRLSDDDFVGSYVMMYRPFMCAGDSFDPNNPRGLLTRLTRSRSLWVYFPANMDAKPFCYCEVWNSNHYPKRFQEEVVSMILWSYHRIEIGTR